MAKTYTVAFGSGDPRSFTGLNPTLLIFVNAATGATIAAPAFSEALTGSGIYKFTWGTTTPIAFLADAATTSPGANARFVVGQLDPVDRMDEVGTTLVGYGNSTLAFGVTSLAIGTTLTGYGVSILAIANTILANTGTGPTLVNLIGTTASLIGNLTTDPSDLFGYLKRIGEILQGRQTFTKGSGVLDFYDRTGATQLAERTVSNNASLVTKA